LKLLVYKHSLNDPNYRSCLIMFCYDTITFNPIVNHYNKILVNILPQDLINYVCCKYDPYLGYGNYIIDIGNLICSIQKRQFKRVFTRLITYLFNNMYFERKTYKHNCTLTEMKDIINKWIMQIKNDKRKPEFISLILDRIEQNFNVKFFTCNRYIIINHNKRKIMKLTNKLDTLFDIYSLCNELYHIRGNISHRKKMYICRIDMILEKNRLVVNLEL